MSSNGSDQWYLIRTKPAKERWVRDQLSPRLPEVFLPMLKARVPRWGRLTMSVAPLFPCYLFARFDLQIKYFEIKYLAGVTGMVSAGPDPIVVAESIISEIRARGINDVVEIPEVPFNSGQLVRVVEGPFRGFEAIFERYLSSTERVAILLNTIENAGPRIVLPASALAKYT
jgi:transcriptional antiterminator RfaH